MDFNNPPVTQNESMPEVSMAFSQGRDNDDDDI